MSYFPCDIPFMSDEELKENGIRIPKKRITNREKLARMSNQELADWLCSQNTNCDTCRKRKMCSWFRQDGFLKWLETEEDDDFWGEE